MRPRLAWIYSLFTAIWFALLIFGVRLESSDYAALEVLWDDARFYDLNLFWLNLASPFVAGIFSFREICFFASLLIILYVSSLGKTKSLEFFLIWLAFIFSPATILGLSNTVLSFLAVCGGVVYGLNRWEKTWFRLSPYVLLSSLHGIGLVSLFVVEAGIRFKDLRILAGTSRLKVGGLILGGVVIFVFALSSLVKGAPSQQVSLSDVISALLYSLVITILVVRNRRVVSIGVLVVITVLVVANLNSFKLAERSLISYSCGVMFFALARGVGSTYSAVALLAVSVLGSFFSGGVISFVRGNDFLAFIFS